MTGRNRFVTLVAMFAIAWPNGIALATSIAQSALEKPLTLTEGQQVIVDLRDGRQVRGAAGPLVDVGFNVFPAEGRRVFVGLKEFVSIRDAATGANVLLPLTLTQGQQVIVDLRDGRHVRGVAGPIVDGGFNVFPPEGRPVFVGPKEFVSARDAETGAAVLLPTPRNMSGGTKGLIAVGVVAGVMGLLFALLHNDK